MAAILAIDALLRTIQRHEPYCNLSLQQGLPHERELTLLFSTLKTRNLYKIDIDYIYSKLQTIINETPIAAKYPLLNKYYSHSWISHVSYQFNVTPLAIFVTLLRKYVIRKKFDVLWNILVLLLQNGAFPLLSPFQNTDSSHPPQILSLRLIWSLYVNLFNFMDDEHEILQRVSFVLSFVDRFEFNVFRIDNAYFSITAQFPSICAHHTDTNDTQTNNIPSPSFLRLLLQHGFPMFDHTNCALSAQFKPYHLCFAKYHALMFDEKLDEFRAVYTALEKRQNFPALMDEIHEIVVSMVFGDKLITKWRHFAVDSNINDMQNMYKIKQDEDWYYLYHSFALNMEWIKWSFQHIWSLKSDQELKRMIDALNQQQLFLSKWSPRVRESSCYHSVRFVSFYFKIVEFQQSLPDKEISFWMKKYENNSEILQLLFKQKYAIRPQFEQTKLFDYFWNVLCHKDATCVVLRLLNKHLIDLSLSDDGQFEYIWKPLFHRFCDQFTALNWKIKNNLMLHMVELLQQLKLNGLEIVNTRYALQCIFNGASSQIFKTLTTSLLNVREIEAQNNGSVDVVFEVFRERGKYVQQRHKNMMIVIGKWLLAKGYKENIMRFVDALIVDCQSIQENDALKQKQSVMIKRFQIEWNLR